MVAESLSILEPTKVTKLERLDRYNAGMLRLQRVWAYLLRRKMRLM